MMRAGLYRPVHVKTLRSQKLRMLLTHRKLLQSKAIAIENDLRGTLRNFSLKVGIVGKVQFEAASGSLLRTFPTWRCWSSRCSLSGGRFANRSSSCNAVCWPSSGMMRCAPPLDDDPRRWPVVALTYRATVDVPARFRKSKAVGAVFGLTCAKYQSGEVDRNGRISRCGDEMMRVMLYEAVRGMLRSKKWSGSKPGRCRSPGAAG